MAPSNRHPLRLPAIGLGCSYLLAIVMLGPLLGSTADASTAFAEHFDDDGNRVLDLLGGVALLVAAATLVWTTVTARREAADRGAGSARDLSAIAGVITASTLVVASALLMTVPLMASLGELYDDPGLDAAVQAGIAQAGAVTLFVAALCLAATTVLVARLGRQNRAVPRWINVTGWVVAATLCLGMSVALLMPFAVWAIALGLIWSGERTTHRAAPGAQATNATVRIQEVGEGEPMVFVHGADHPQASAA